MHIGTARNKNLSNTIKALKGLTFKLIVVGKLSTRELKIAEQCSVELENHVNISPEKMLALYDSVTALSFCSTYEGFGLPIIEAMARGTPVITSAVGSMKEVAGDAAILVDPHDINSIHNAFVQLEDPEKLKDLIARGHENIKRFNHEDYKRAYIRLLDECLNPTDAITTSRD